MSAQPIERRDFLGLALGAAGGALAEAIPAAAKAAAATPAVTSGLSANGASPAARALAAGVQPAIFVYDGSVPEAARWASQVDQANARALAGDRVRFARALLAAAPQSIVGLTRHVDLLLLAGAAEEADYRLVEQRRSADPRPPGGRVALVAWRMQQRRNG